MLEQTSQNAAPPPGTLLEGNAFEQRTAGPFTYRMATPMWRGVVLQLLEKWYATETPNVDPNVDRYPVASFVGMPPHMGTAGRSSGAELIAQLEAQGWGVILIPEGEKGTLVRTKSAERAGKLTLGDSTKTTVVLSEPADGWEDIGPGRYVAFPVMFVVGFVAVLAAMVAVRG